MNLHRHVCVGAGGGGGVCEKEGERERKRVSHTWARGWVLLRSLVTQQVKVWVLGLKYPWEALRGC